MRKPTAIASEADGSALLVFFDKGVARVYGEGPNDQGVGGSWSQPQWMQGAAVGAASNKSVISTPVGVFFEDTEQGIWMIRPGESEPVHVGEGATDMLGTNTVIDTTLVPDRKQVAFLLSNGTDILLYHYDPSLRNELGFGPWSVTVPAVAFGQTPLITAIAHESVRLAFCRDDGDIWRESATSYQDNGVVASNLLDFTTGYITLGDMQGYKRLWDVWITGESGMTNAVLAVDVESDRGGTSETYTCSGLDEEFHLAGARMHIANQRGEAFRLRILQSFGEGSVDGYMAITGIRCEFGVERGARKSGNTMIIGSGG